MRELFRDVTLNLGCVAMEVRSSSFSSCARPSTLLAMVTGSFPLFSFVQKLPWKWPYLFPSALEDSIVRPHYNQITQEGDFSFPFLKLDPYLCANRREIQTLAERGPLSGVPDCRGSNPSAASTVQGQARELGRSGILYGLCKCL